MWFKTNTFIFFSLIHLIFHHVCVIKWIQMKSTLIEILTIAETIFTSMRNYFSATGKRYFMSFTSRICVKRFPKDYFIFEICFLCQIFTYKIWSTLNFQLFWIILFQKKLLFFQWSDFYLFSCFYCIIYKEIVAAVSTKSRII